MFTTRISIIARCFENFKWCHQTWEWSAIYVVLKSLKWKLCTYVNNSIWVIHTKSSSKNDITDGSEYGPFDLSDTGLYTTKLMHTWSVFWGALFSVFFTTEAKQIVNCEHTPMTWLSKCCSWDMADERANMICRKHLDEKGLDLYHWLCLSD